MHRSKIARLTADLDGVTIKGTREVEIAVFDADGDLDFDATVATKETVQDRLGWGGFCCGHGGWVLQQDYKTHHPYDFGFNSVCDYRHW